MRHQLMREWWDNSTLQSLGLNHHWIMVWKPVLIRSSKPCMCRSIRACHDIQHLQVTSAAFNNICWNSSVLLFQQQCRRLHLWPANMKYQSKLLLLTECMSITFPCGVTKRRQGNAHNPCDPQTPVIRERKACAAGHHDKSLCTQKQASGYQWLDHTCHNSCRAANTLQQDATDLKLGCFRVRQRFQPHVWRCQHPNRARMFVLLASMHAVDTLLPRCTRVHTIVWAACKATPVWEFLRVRALMQRASSAGPRA